MVSLEWTSNYEIGVEEIDLQHHYFVELINRLNQELSDEADYGYCRSLIDELNAYAHFHFISEENMMMRAGYPYLAEHRVHHQKLLSELSNMEMELDMVLSEGNINNILNFLVSWFRAHTSVEDRKFADFLEQIKTAS